METNKNNSEFSFRMDNILIIGALPQNEEQKQFYFELVNFCKSFAEIVKSPIETKQFTGTDAERYVLGFKSVDDADLIIAETSNPSTGQGMELREADLKNKLVIVIAKEGSKISGMIKGCPAIKEIIFYNSIDNLKEKLNGVISIT